MNPDLEHLVVLQAQDLELTRLRAELLEAPRRVKAAELALTGAEFSLGSCRGRLASEEKLRRGQELEIASHRAKLERLRRSLDSATSAQQVSAFGNEITFGNSAIQTLEDAELASMERTEAFDVEEKTLGATAERLKTSLLAERERAATSKSQNEATIAGIERERGSLRKEISPAPLATYDRLTKSRGTAVAEAIGNATAGKCAACQMGVRPQRWQDLIGRDHLDEIFNCESCGRMLFWDPRRDTPRSWAAGERLQSAQAGGSGGPGSGSGGSR